MKLRRVVVTGIGTINPLGDNIEQYFENLEKGVSGAAPITHFDASKFKTQFACEVKGFDPNEHFDRKEARKYDRFTQFALVAARQAVQDAKLVDAEDKTIDTIDKDQVGVVWASGIGGIETFFNEVKNFALGDGTPKYNPFFIPKMIADIAAGHISMKYGFRGPNYCTVSACSSSNHAFIDALNLIRWGKADIIVSGGSEAVINPAGIGGFNAMQALSTRNDDPATASRPYDTGRDGFVMGEGAGALVLEEYEHAKARGAKIYAEVVGGGMSADAYHLTAPDPNGAGAARAMKEALRDADLTPEAVDYVNTHGTSTPAGDIPELTGIQSVFGDHIYKVNISSTKSMTGHLLGGAAAIEALACIMAIDKGIVPPTINVSERDPQIDERINLTLGTAQRREINCALSNTFGFGGHNSTVIFKKVQ
ncbi:MAG: beta-ketoacyl-ACP synthase II [Rikenellaceae bacterium]|nr:beta-ketoacyl-ACP synthase II [Rikenellaceae bacterium]